MIAVSLIDERKSGHATGVGENLDSALRACLWSASRSRRNNLHEMLIIKTLLKEVPTWFEFQPEGTVACELVLSQYHIWIR
jgi:hypothetical protein